MDEQSYSFRATCKLTGLNESTLRAWEARYGAVEPRRLSNGRRVYSAADIDKLRILIRAKDLGHSIGQIASLPKESIEEILVTHRRPNEVEASRSSYKRRSDATVGNSFPRRMMAHLQNYDFFRVHDELIESRSQSDLPSFILDVMVPLFAYLGRSVIANQISIPKEHAFSAILKSHLFHEFFKIARPVPHDSVLGELGLQRVALATPEGDFHEFGILIAAILCADRGLAVNYLGASIPLEPLSDAVQALRCDALIVSVTHIASAQVARNPRDFILQLAFRLPKNCQIWVGAIDKNEFAGLEIQQTLRLFGSMEELYEHLHL